MKTRQQIILEIEREIERLNRQLVGESNQNEVNDICYDLQFFTCDLNRVKANNAKTIEKWQTVVY